MEVASEGANRVTPPDNTIPAPSNAFVMNSSPTAKAIDATLTSLAPWQGGGLEAEAEC